MTSRRFWFSTGFVGIALLLSLNGSALRAQGADPKPSTSDVKAQADSARVTKLLSEAKWRSALAEYDAETLVTYTYGDIAWQVHAAELRTIAEHVNDLGKVVQQLNSVRSEASPWQQVAIDRINPLLNNMAKSLNATIKELNDHQERVNTVEYRDYLRTSADMVSLTATSISDFVQYSRAGQQTEALQRRLELPPK